MPRKGTTKLPKEKRARIIAEKQVKIHTVPEIAEQNGVGISTVYQAEVNADPETFALAADFKQQLIYKGGLNATAGLDVIARRIQSDKEPLSSVVAATKLSHDIYRLETGQSTQNNQVQRSPEERAIDFVRMLLEHRKTVDGAIEILRRSSVLEDRFGLTAERRDAFLAKLESGE